MYLISYNNFIKDIVKEDFKGDTHLIFADYLQENKHEYAKYFRDPSLILKNRKLCLEVLKLTWYSTPESFIKTYFHSFCKQSFSEQASKHPYFVLQNQNINFYVFPHTMKCYAWMQGSDWNEGWYIEDIDNILQIMPEIKLYKSIICHLYGYDKLRKFCLKSGYINKRLY